MRLGGRKSIVSTQNPKSIAALWAFSLFWCALSGGMFYAWAVEAGDIVGTLFTGLFLLIGLAMLWGAIRMSLEYTKFGAVRLTLDELPAVGRRVAALLEMPESVAAAGHLSAELACIRVTYTQGSEGGNSSKSEDEWSERHRIPIRRLVRGAAAEMFLDIPAALHPTDVPGSHEASSTIDFDRVYHKWELRVVGEVEGIDLNRTFDVQVLPSGAAAAAPLPAGTGAARPAVPRVSEVNPVIDMTRGTPAAAGAHLKRALVFAGLIGAGIAAVVLVLSDFAPLDAPPDSASSSPQVEPLRHPRAADAVDLQAGPEATEFVALQAGELPSRLREAVIAQAMGRYAEAAPLFQETLAAVERDHGDKSPLAALVHHRISVMYLRQQRHLEQEQALLRALQILEQYSAAEVKSAPGMHGQPLDIEMILADLGYAYWEQRRYDQAYVWYQRAYDAAGDLDVSEDDRNRRLAVSSAGLMASACTQGKWDVADRAMAELKERRVKVDSGLRLWLDYWVRTGEPRLAARKC